MPRMNHRRLSQFWRVVPFVRTTRMGGVVLGLFAGLVHLSGAIPDEFLIQRWDTASGLPHNTVRAIAQSPSGYLWLGTENGLARFDGVHFENFGRENTTVLQDPNVQFLQTDSSGTLWVGTGNRLYAWDGRQLTQQNWPVVIGDQTDRLLVSRTNEVFFSSIQGCLVRGQRLPGGGWQWTSSPPAGPCIFAVDAAGKIWRLTLGGRLWRMNGLEAERVEVPEATGLIIQMTADASGRVWLGT